MFENLENNQQNIPAPESKTPSVPMKTKSESEISAPKISLEERIEKLVTKGKRRGKRYSIIGISVSLIIAAIVIYVGYYLFTEVGQITGDMNKQSEAIIKTESADTNGRCKDNCCLASLEKMKKHGMSEVDVSGACPDGHRSNKLDCDTSVVWCETLEIATNTEPVFQPEDSDLDGLSDADEAKYGTDINNPDTDGDGYNDGDEISGGYDPNGDGKLSN
jgi:hypothetical protein